MKIIEEGSIVGLKDKKKQYALEQQFKVPFSAVTTGKTVLVVDANGSHISRIPAQYLEISSGEKTPK